MTDTGNNALEFETSLNFFYENVRKKNPNYFELFGIPTNATHRDIEAAYKKYCNEFNEQKGAAISNPEMLKKLDFLVNLGKRGFEVITNFEKRAEYEKKGFREVDPDDVKEEDPEEVAKEIYKKAKSLYNQKNYRLAVKGLKEAVYKDPKKADYFLLLGRAQSQLPDMKREAEVNLNKAMEMEGWNVEPIVALGMLFQSERLYKRAESYFRKALEIQNDHAVAKKKLEEVAGPQEKPLDKVGKTIKEGLGKVFPSIFGKKR